MKKEVCGMKVTDVTTGSKNKGYFSRLGTNIRKHKLLYVMALPVIAYYLIFHYFPMYGIIIAFQQFVPAKGFLGSEWVGFKHFIDFFNDVYFLRTVRNTLLLNLYSLVFGFPIPIIFALLLNEVKNRYFKSFTQTITYMPHFISSVVICGIVADFTSPGGLISQIVGTITGNPSLNLLGNAAAFPVIFTVMNIWQGFGWGSIIYFASISSIDPTLYEAASIDGASRFRQAINITLPSIMPTMVIMLILRLGQMMSLGWEKIILLSGPLTYETADVISTYTYRRGILEMNYSYGAAIGLFNSAVNLVLILTANKISQKVNETSMW